MATKRIGASLEQAMPKANEDMDTQMDMDTMHRAAGIASDPVKLAKVHKLAGRRHKALLGMIEPLMKPAKKKIKSMADLRQVANAKDNKVDDTDNDMG